VPTQRAIVSYAKIDGRTRVPKSAMMQVWFEKIIFIPQGNRCFSAHLIQGQITLYYKPTNKLYFMMPQFGGRAFGALPKCGIITRIIRIMLA